MMMITMKKQWFAALLAAAAMAISSASMAQGMMGPDSGWYIGGSLGQSSAKDACDGLAGTGISCDDEDTAWKFFAGYQINRNFAVELGYTDLGEVSASALGLTETIETTAWEIVGVGSFPIADRLSLYGKLGFYRAETEDRTNFGFSADESNTDLTFGFGVRYDFTRNLGLRAEWQRYSDVGGGDIGESDVDVLSLGLVWKF